MVSVAALLHDAIHLLLTNTACAAAVDDSDTDDTLSVALPTRTMLEACCAVGGRVAACHITCCMPHHLLHATSPAACHITCCMPHHLLLATLTAGAAAVPDMQMTPCGSSSCTVLKA
jgi:hypothetical protein